MRSRRLTVVLMMLAGLLGVSGIAMAEHEESHPEDTWFSFAYDWEDHIVAINTDDNDTEECHLENGSISGTYDEGDEDEPLEVVLDGYEDCEVWAAVVGGPNDQINHGQFVKAGMGLVDIQGHGCVVRYLAQSDIGRTEETKVQGSDIEPVELDGESDFDFKTFEADCDRGHRSEASVAADNHADSHGRPESPGNSGAAPGRNK